MTAIDAAIPSAIFSTSSPVLPTSPRVIRANAFSSRSSASEPATRSTVTNIRVTVIATAIAKVSSAELSPATTVLSTAIGSATAPSRGNAKSRLSPASSPNRITRSRAFWLAGGSCWRSASRIWLLRFSPSTSNSPISGRSKTPPSISRSRYVAASSEIRCERIRFASVTRAEIRSSTRLAFTGSSSLTSTSTVGCCGLRLASDSSSSRRSSGRIRAAITSPSSTFCSASSRVETSTHSTREQSSSRAMPWSMPSCSPPIWNCSVSDSGTRLRNATRGFEPSLDRAKPIRTPSTTG